MKVDRGFCRHGTPGGDICEPCSLNAGRTVRAADPDVGYYPSCYCGRLHMIVPAPAPVSCGDDVCHPPRRVRMRRTRGWTKPLNTIYVGRPSRWGNIFKIGDGFVGLGAEQSGKTAGFYSSRSEDWRWCDIELGPPDAAAVVAAYRHEMFGVLTTWADTTQPGFDPDDAVDWIDLVAGLAGLRGHDLACWCDLDQPCHADVLLEYANNPTRTWRAGIETAL